MVVAIIVLVVLALLSVFFSLLARFAVRPRVWGLEDTRKQLIQLPYMEGEPIELVDEHTITTFDGQKLYVGFVPGDPENKHYVVLSHGYTSSRYGMYKYAAQYRRFGYNCVVYDNRGHGINKPAVVSFGYREARDLMTVIEDTYARYGDDIQLGLHGESMGSGLQLTALQYQPRVDFIVNDCGYADILHVLRWKCHQTFHLPEWFADVASIYARLWYGFSFHQVRPIDHLLENEVPICFVHGEADDFIPMWHSQRMHEATKGYSEIHLYPGAGHAVSIDTDVERYRRMLQEFLAKVYPQEPPKCKR